jgi:hypothetical protein
MTVDNELERMRKEAVVMYCKMLLQNLPGGAEVNHEKSQYNPCPC